MGIFGLGHKHLGAETLTEYLDDRLSAGARERVQQVAAGCPDCSLELDALGQTRLLLRQLPEITPRRSFFISPSNEPVTAPPATTWVRFPQWVYAGTASLAALVLTLMVVVDATGLVAPGRTTEQASYDSPASSQSQQESPPVMMDSPAMESAALTESAEAVSAVITTEEISEAAPSEEEFPLMADSPPIKESAETAEASPIAQEISEAAPPRDQFLVTTDSSTPMAAAQAESVRARSIEATPKEATPKEAAADKEAAFEDTGEAASLTRADRSESDSMAATESEASTEDQPDAIASPTATPPDEVLKQQAKTAATPEAMSSATKENDASGEPPVEATTTAEAAGVEDPGRVDEMTEGQTPEAGPESEDAAAGDLGPPSQEGIPPPADAANPSSRVLLLWRGLEGLAAVLALAFTAVWLWKRRQARR